MQEYAIRFAWEHGHFFNPENPDGLNVTQDMLPSLRVTDQVVIDALISLSKADATAYTRATLDAHGRVPNFDGELGPAMQRMIESPEGRCPVPDYAPPPGVVFAFDNPWLQQVAEDMQRRAVLPAYGSGNWRGCHGVGEFHSATVRVDSAKLPSFLRPLFVDVLSRVQKAYANVGLLFRFLDEDKTDLITGEEFDSNINIEMSFVSSSDGWIGLAIVGTGETCGGNIWCRFLNTYKGGSTTEAIVTQWVTLIKHELGHNTGRSHTNGGVMNPSIVNNLPNEWVDADPSTAWLRKQFGGVPVPIPGTPIPPKPPGGGGPVDATQKQIDAINLKNVVQDVQIQWLTDQVRALKGGR